jgi:hypothetical protein
MANPTREEMDAKFEAIEARMETRFVELTGKMDRLADGISNLTTALSTVRTEAKEDAKFTRWTIIVTIVASLLAFGSALWITQGNMLAAFTAGIALRGETKEATPPPSHSVPSPQH